MPAVPILLGFGPIPDDNIPSGLFQKNFVCDDEADLPTSGFAIGSRAACINQHSFFLCVVDEEWSKLSLAAVFQQDFVDVSAEQPLEKKYLVRPWGAGMYRVSYSARVVSPGVTSTLGGTNGFQVGYYASTDGAFVLTKPGPTDSDNTDQARVDGTIIISAQADSWILFSFGYLSTGDPMLYSLHVEIEAL